jgi:cell surface hyaluronidase
MNLRSVLSLFLVALGMTVLPGHAQILYPADNGFETPDLGTPGGSNVGYLYNPTGTPWTFSGNAGITANGGQFDVEGATQGQHDGASSSAGQAGFVQGLGSISQSVYLTGGEYSLTFDIEGRGGVFFPEFSPDEVSVSLGGTQLYDAVPGTTLFTDVTSSTTALLPAGYYNLVFSGETSGDFSSFVDNIRINQTDAIPVVAPEPSSVVAFVMGLAALAVVRRSRRRTA